MKDPLVVSVLARTLRPRILLLVAIALGILELPACSQRRIKELHVSRMPKLDLTSYSILYIEDFEMKDRQVISGTRRNFSEADTQWAREASIRLPNMIKSKIDGLPPTLNPFATVKRELTECEQGSLVLRGEILQYKPGGGLGYLLPGFGFHRMKLRVRLVDATSNEELAAFTVDRDSGPEGTELKEMERNVAGELAEYLRRCAF